MHINYHTHTMRCHHASAHTEREYVEAAIAQGFTRLGFADHTPHPFPDGYVSGIRMTMEELEDYVTTLRALRDEYRGQIEIHIGLEVEYYPALFAGLQQAARDYEIEYFLLAQHFLGNEIGEKHVQRPDTPPDQLRRYCRQLMDGIDTGCFTYLAHPDVIRYSGDPAHYEEQMRMLCRHANAADIPVEINLLGLREDRHYPTEAFWKVAGEEGCKVILGSDAHSADHFDHPPALQKAHALVERYHLQLLEDVTLRRPY